MKTIQELRSNIDFNIREMNYQLKYFSNRNIDFDVFLPTKGMNLQRPYVWQYSQKKELLMSVFIGRHIPRIAIINVVDKTNKDFEKIEVIDGKQRLLTLISYLNNEYYIDIEGEMYYFSDLPNDYKLALSNLNLSFYECLEPWDKPITDEQKINWFVMINFAGTIQDETHIYNLKNKLK